MAINFERKIENVPANERRNWPKGASKSSHDFMDLETSPIVGRKYYNNEEIFYLYALRRNELLAQGQPRAAAEYQAKIEVLPIIYPAVDLINFKQDNPDLADKCCRAIFGLGLDSIANIHIVHGEALKLYQIAVSGDEDLQIPDDPSYGWDLTNPQAGFPCINLTSDGCAYHADGTKPHRCKAYPVYEGELRFIETCNYRFRTDGQGRYIRTGNCNRCK